MDIVINIDSDFVTYAHVMLYSLEECNAETSFSIHIINVGLNDSHKKDFIVKHPKMDFHFYELMRMYANALEKENALMFAAGFSFADEHIASITKRAADVNPTLQIIVFVFNDVEEDSFKKRLGLTPACVNNNITILTPSKFKQDNPEDEYKVLVDTITYFDMKTISNVFNFIEKHIYG